MPMGWKTKNRGKLNLEKAWQKFVQKKGGNESVWSFSALWESNWGRKEEKAGYVFVNNKKDSLFLESLFLKKYLFFESSPFIYGFYSCKFFCYIC